MEKGGESDRWENEEHPATLRHKEKAELKLDDDDGGNAQLNREKFATERATVRSFCVNFVFGENYH